MILFSWAKYGERYLEQQTTVIVKKATNTEPSSGGSMDILCMIMTFIHLLAPKGAVL